MKTNQIEPRRALVFSARIRFAPETQPLRETAIDKIIEQNLLIADCEEGITPQEIEKQGALCFEDTRPAISRVDMDKSLNRLVNYGRLYPIGDKREKRYRLNEDVRQELMEMQRRAEKGFERVVGRLFQNAEGGASSCAGPFFECLCIIFSKLGETYVRLIKGEISHEQLLRSSTVVRALHEINKNNFSIDWAVFEHGVFSFFQDSDPEYDAIKWNMAQNYYIAKALGLDPSGYLLSKEVFENAIFYLDTNVAIHALDPDARHHRSFETLVRACEELKIKLNVCQISLDELRHVLEFQREIIEKVADQIPEDMHRRIRGDFFQIYRQRAVSVGRVDFDDVFSRFISAREELARDYNVILVDDSWFDQAAGNKRTTEVLEGVKYQYIAARRRTKSPTSALHDALLLQWIQLERERGAKNTWVVTLDTSLPGVVLVDKGTSTRPMAITLDALMQWISPIAVRGNAEDEFAGVFAQALKYMLLPQETFFDTGDFLMFAEMEWSCKELPSQDIEACIKYIKANAPGLNITDPLDREKIAHEVTKFFADPSRKYKQELQRLESQVGSLCEELKGRDHEVETIKLQLEVEKRKRHKDILRKSGWLRLMIVFLFFVASEAAVGWLAAIHGEGQTLFQRLVNSWPFLGTIWLISVGLSWFVLGKERIHALGWPFDKLFKNGPHIINKKLGENEK